MYKALKHGASNQRDRKPLAEVLALQNVSRPPNLKDKYWDANMKNIPKHKPDSIQYTRRSSMVHKV